MRAFLAGLCIALAGCGAAEVASGGANVGSGDAQAVDGLDATTVPVADALTAAQLATDAEARALLHLRNEAGFDVFQAPALPGPNDRVLFVVLLPASYPLLPGTGAASWTADGWKTTRNASAQTFGALGRTGLLLDLGKQAAGTSVQAAFTVLPSDQIRVWLNNDGQNYSASVGGFQSLTWAGITAFAQDGVGRNLPTDALFAGHDLTVHAESYPETPGANAVVHWTADDFGSVATVPMRVEAIHAGTTGHNTRFVATLPTAGVAAGAKVRAWLEVLGPLNAASDSNGNQDYASSVVAAPQPTWAEVGVYAFNKGHPDGNGGYQAGWFYNSGLANPLSATPGDFQAYAANPYPAVELYVPGITDRADAAAVGAGGFLRVEVYSPFFGSDPSAAWTGHALDFREVHGNNLRFAWAIVDRAAPHQPALGAACPVDGSYPFKFRISTDGGQTWQWLGTGGLPSGGANRTMTFASLTYGPALSASGATAFGSVQKGHSKTDKLTLTNPNAFAVQLSGFSVSGAGFSATIAGCSAAASCSKTLAAGGTLQVSAKFAPSSTGDKTGAIHFNLTDTSDACAGHGTWDVALSGTGS